MHGGQPRLSTVSRRTRSQWDAFYRNRYNEINIKKPTDQDNSVSINNNGDFGTTKNEAAGSSHVKKSDSSLISIIEDSESSNSDDSENTSIINDDDDDDEYKKLNICKINNVEKKGKRRKKTNSDLITEELDLINTLLDSRCKDINKDTLKEINPAVDDIAVMSPAGYTDLPLKFKFDQESSSCLAEKTDWEKEIDSLFGELEMALWESEIGCTNFSSLSDDEFCRDIDESPAARCSRGEHETVVDEQIGIVCKYCCDVLMDIRHVLPPFYVEPPDRRKWKNYYYKEYSHKSMMRNNIEIQFEGSANCGNLESCCIHSQGTVFDLIPPEDADAKDKQLYPHQLEGFEFLWRNIAGDIHIDKLETLPAKGGRGCIISHAPGTGKTRMTIVFLQTFMKLYPTCRPVIIAPLGMLLTWEQEFNKWNVDIKFHNLNKTKLSGHETAIADQTCAHEKNIDYTRLVKLRSWMMGGSILGISYRLFEQLTNNDKLKKILVELPCLLVMDEGHNPRNKKSQTWKALTKVKTRRRVMLSGTPFQNNFLELYNTLCLVNPRFMLPSGHDGNIKNSGRKRKFVSAVARDEWANLTSSISNNNNLSCDFELKKLRSMMEPFVHIYKGGILEKNLPGMRDCLIILKPTDLQSELLRDIPQSNKFLEQAHLASLISVHPALVAKKTEFSHHKSRLDLVKFDPNAGVKTRFLVKLIQLSAQLNEKVLVFSQFIVPLRHIKKLLKQHFSWNQGRQVIYISGKMGINERQRLMNSFNDKGSEAKVLLASQKACSEGINLVGASRVVLLDVVWNPSVERQAICRAYRLGQEKVVHVYRLLTWAEVNNKYARQVEKERLSELIFSGGDGVKTTRTTTMTGRCNEEEDKVLEAMVRHQQSHASMFERIVHQPKEYDFNHIYF